MRVDTYNDDKLNCAIERNRFVENVLINFFHCELDF